MPAKVYDTLGSVSAMCDGESNRSLPVVIVGEGDPEGSVMARKGTLFINLNGGTGKTLYVKETGNESRNGWAAK